MSTRIDYAKVVPGALRAMYSLETYLHDCGLEASLVELDKMRASQIVSTASKDENSSVDTVGVWGFKSPRAYYSCL